MRQQHSRSISNILIMCGILAILGLEFEVDQTPQGAEMRRRAVELATRLRHRGPDWSGVHTRDNHILCHERLAIVGVENGAQPLVSEDGKVALAVNGEIYNHKDLEAKLLSMDKKYTMQTQSDCECIMFLHEAFGNDCASMLDGDFAFVLLKGHGTDSTYYVARDPMGVDPLYWGTGKDGKSKWFASELKCLADDCESFEEFPPGHYYTPETGLVKYFNPEWKDRVFPPTRPVQFTTGDAALASIRSSLEKAVTKRLMSDVPYGVLLSGGLDSSLVASIAARHAKMRVEDDERSEAWWPRLHSFAIGVKGAPDLVAAKKVADQIGTVHHEFHFTEQEGIDAVQNVIRHLETFDVTTIRASTPMFLLSRKVRAMGVKMVLSGEGADELFGGYLYFHLAPNEKEMYEETAHRVDILHKFDVLRANKSCSSWGVEVRVPFLDQDVIDAAFKVHPKEKMCVDGKIEKHVVRAAFDDKENPYLPSEVLWRQKEQFSDGVGYSWIDMLKEYTTAQVTDEEFAQASQRFPVKTPQTKEAYYYRKLFDEIYSHPSAVDAVSLWIPKQAWGADADPSGRAQKVHSATLQK